MSFPKPFLMNLFSFLPEEDVVLFQRVAKTWLLVSKAFFLNKPNPKVFSEKGRLYWIKQAVRSISMLNIPNGRGLTAAEGLGFAELEQKLRANVHMRILAKVEQQSFRDEYGVLEEELTPESWIRFLLFPL